MLYRQYIVFDIVYCAKSMRYYYHIFKKVNRMLLHTKLNNSQMYFRDISIDYHDP